MKKIPLILCSSWPTLIIIYACLCISNPSHLVSSQCLDHQKSLLVGLKTSFKFEEAFLPDPLGDWNESSDCCQWNGIECDNSSASGHVTSLDLSQKGIVGDINNFSNLFLLQFLRRLDLSGNSGIKGILPSSIGNLKSLHTIDLSGCNFQGSISTSIGNLTELTDMDLSYNQLSGTIPSLSLAKNLKSVALHNNHLSGPITTTDWGKLVKLVKLDLSYNSLRGSIPSALFSLPALQSIELQGNKFSGRMHEFSKPTSSILGTLDLSSNNIEGPVPITSVFHLQGLAQLDLSSNRFNGTLQLAEILLSLENLMDLNLSYNSLSINIEGCGENSSFPQQLFSLQLASCQLRTIPKFLKHQTSIVTVDLSMNQIYGTVPWWMWEIGNRFYYSLNLSFNYLQHVEPPHSITNTTMWMGFLDIHSNNIQGQFPVVSTNLEHLDCSDNNFSSIDPEFNKGTNWISVSFARNNLKGSILSSFCNLPLELLNLEGNHINGTFPDCDFMSLLVLNLRGNNLEGIIPDTFGNNSGLLTLDLNGNFLQGIIPRSLANCTPLRVLDLGNNQLNDTFPCHLESLSDLRVLMLRSNKFHGTIVCPGSESSHPIWPKLQIVDIASNHFGGELTSDILLKWTLMMAGTSAVHSDQLLSLLGVTGNYQNSVIVTFKGNTYRLAYILTTFCIVDFSDNAFHGKLPEEIGNLNALVVLNLSHNSFSGKIPSSIGNLSQIESLDLSCNAFSGNIPAQLANLIFLEYLNLSFNKLSGKIPTGSQLQLFNATSYEGNQGLYGPPLTPISRNRPENDPSTPSQGSDWSSKSRIEWMLRGSEVGFPVGITTFIGPLLYIKRYREWYCKLLNKLVMRILNKEDINASKRRRISRQQRRRR